MPAKKSTKISPPVQSNNSDSENDSLSSDEEVVQAKVTKTKIKAEPIEDDSEDVEHVSEDETEDESESESEEVQEKKSKEKKSKESVKEILTQVDGYLLDIKSIDKEILEIKKLLKIKEKKRNDIERQYHSKIKPLSKLHSDEVTKARKEKTKRKVKNPTGGFNSLQPVPEILIKFLNLSEEDKCLTRPQVVSKLSNKFAQLGLKKGQNTTLNKEVVKELGLDKSYIDKVIEFGKFQTFLKGFFPTKEEKNTVSVN